MWHTQGNTIFHSIHAIFDKGLFPKCTNSYVKEYKLYNKLLDRTSLETESLVSNSSEKDEPAPVLIPHTPIPLIQNNPLTHSPSLTPEPKKPMVEIEEANNVDSNIEIQLSSS